MDAVVFGHLAVHYYAELPSNKLKVILLAFPNLVKYVEELKSSYLASWSPAKGTFSPRKRCISPFSFASRKRVSNVNRS